LALLITKKFIVARAKGIGQNSETLVILSDYKFWANHTKELADWCAAHDHVTTKGMTVVFGNTATLTAFLLRWA